MEAPCWNKKEVEFSKLLKINYPWMNINCDTLTLRCRIIKPLFILITFTYYFFLCKLGSGKIQEAKIF